MRNAVEKKRWLALAVCALLYALSYAFNWWRKKPFHGLSCSENRHSRAGESPVAREVHLCGSIFQSFTKATMLAVT